MGKNITETNVALATDYLYACILFCVCARECCEHEVVINSMENVAL